MSPLKTIHVDKQEMLFTSDDLSRRSLLAQLEGGGRRGCWRLVPPWFFSTACEVNMAACRRRTMDETISLWQTANFLDWFKDMDHLWRLLGVLGEITIAVRKDSPFYNKHRASELFYRVIK